METERGEERKEGNSGKLSNDRVGPKVREIAARN